MYHGKDPVGKSLWAAVLARPQDKHLRLVYADWLEESGHDYLLARFIRAQIDNDNQTASHILVGKHPKGSTCLRHWTESLRRVVRPAEPLLSRLTYWIHFSDGFPCHLTLPLHVWGWNAEKLRKKSPITQVFLYSQCFHEAEITVSTRMLSHACQGMEYVQLSAEIPFQRWRQIYETEAAVLNEQLADALPGTQTRLILSWHLD